MSKTRIYKIKDVRLSILESSPPKLLVETQGIAAVGGWTSIELQPMEKKLSPDGILDLEILGTPPNDPTAQVVPTFPVQASLIWENEVDRVVGVRVVARANELSRLLSESRRMSTRMYSPGGVIPQPDGTGDGDDGPVITLGEDMPTLMPGEDQPTGGSSEDPPTWFEEGEERPTFGEEKPTYGIEDIPSDAEAEDWPTLGEDVPTIGEDPPTFAEQEPTKWETLPTIFPGEDGKHWITDNPPGPLPPTNTWWETQPPGPRWPPNYPGGPWYPNPNPYEPFGDFRPVGRWVYYKGRWRWVNDIKQVKKSPFGRR